MTMPAGESLAGVRLISARPHVVAKLHEQSEEIQPTSGPDPEVGLRRDEVELSGEGWADRVREILGTLTYSERAATVAMPLGGAAGSGVPMSAEQLIERLDSSWYRELTERGEMRPSFQPIVRLSDGSTYGFESLIRGFLDGQTFNGGQIIDAARARNELFALDQRCRTLALEHGIPQLQDSEELFINFNPSAIYDPEICLRTTWATAARFDFPLSRICFEVVETEQFDDIGFLKKILDTYRERGAKVALDDLGAGTASLNYLTDLRPDVVKLDRGLVTGIDESLPRQRLVASIVDYAHEQGTAVVAEGIENERELEAVRALGADLGQGWHLAKPAPEAVRISPEVVLGAGGRSRAPSIAGHPAVLGSGIGAALDAISDGVLIADATAPDAPIAYCNETFSRLTGFDVEEVVGKPIGFIQDREADAATRERIRSAMRAGEPVSARVLNHRGDGSRNCDEILISPVRDHGGRVIRFVGVLRNGGAGEVGGSGTRERATA